MTSYTTIPIFTEQNDTTQSVYSKIVYLSKICIAILDYVIVMSPPVDTQKDAHLLTQSEIIALGQNERFSTTFHSLIKDCLKEPNI